MKINKNIIYVSILFAVILINYANIFSNEFVFDDTGFIVENYHTREVSNIPSFFSEPSQSNLYRPLRSAFYTLNYQLWKLDKFGYHLNSLLLHLSVTVLLFFITLMMTKKRMFAFVVSLLFASHPIHTARVTNMTAAFDIYGILFMLLSFLFYILFSNSKKRFHYYISIIFYLIALFSSEEAITLILILALFDMTYNYKLNKETFKILMRRYSLYIISTIFYLIVRFSVLQQIGRTETYYRESFLITQLTTVKIFGNYFLSLFYPVNLIVHRSIESVRSILDPYFLLSLLVILITIFIFIKSYKKSKILFFSIGIFFISLLPFTNLFPQVTIIADRYLYLPSFGFVLFLTFIIFNIKKISLIKKHSRTITIILIILILSSYTFLTIQRNEEFRDSVALFKSTIEKNPGRGTMAHVSLAENYMRLKDYENAIYYSFKALELQPDNYYAYKNLGRINIELKNYDLAIEYYEKSLEIKPDLYQSYNNLGLVYSYMDDLNKSIYYLNKAIDMNPEISKAYNDVGTVYAKLGEFDPAIESIIKAISINKYNADYHYNLAIIYEFLGEKELALNEMDKASELEPDNPKIIDKLDEFKN